MIKISAGTAHVLGIKKLAINALPTTAYLMSGERCAHDCGFCPQARNANAGSDMLSRVTWVKTGKAEVIQGVGTAYRSGQLERVCLQVVDGCNSLDRVKSTVNQLKQNTPVPICVSTKLHHREELLELAQAGVDRIGLALDAACQRVFEATKTGSWQETLNQIEESARLLPGRISTHLIVGLGETEEEMVHMLQHMWDMGVTVGLFAFTPVPGTRMAETDPPALDTYRRIQAANYLISKGLVNVRDCTFDSGKLVSYGSPAQRLKDHLLDGKAFETSGCPGCNRPYYNEKPGGTMYNYPRTLTADEIEEALKMVF